jgi:hypothetical protein
VPVSVNLHWQPVPVLTPVNQLFIPHHRLQAMIEELYESVTQMQGKQ